MFSTCCCALPASWWLMKSCAVPAVDQALLLCTVERYSGFTEMLLLIFHSSYASYINMGLSCGISSQGFPETRLGNPRALLHSPLFLHIASCAGHEACTYFEFQAREASKKSTNASEALAAQFMQTCEQQECMQKL